MHDGLSAAECSTIHSLPESQCLTSYSTGANTHTPASIRAPEITLPIRRSRAGSKEQPRQAQAAKFRIAQVRAPFHHSSRCSNSNLPLATVQYQLLFQRLNALSRDAHNNLVVDELDRWKSIAKICLDRGRGSTSPHVEAVQEVRHLQNMFVPRAFVDTLECTASAWP